MDAARELEFYTVEDIYGLPEGERAELIDGQMYAMSSPSRIHQQILGFLYRKIADHIDANQGKCEVNMAPFAVFLHNDNRTYLEPDISVVCDKSKLDDRGCNGAPDWVIEIVSPSSRAMDYYRKLFLYQNAGIREYWVVDPEKQRVSAYHFEQETMEEYSFGEQAPVGIFEGFSVELPK